MTKVYIKLIAMSLALILSVSVVLMSSYAWLVLSGNPAATGMHVAIGGGNTILTAPNVVEYGDDGVIYNYPGRFSDKMNFGQLEQYAYLQNLGNLTPVSTTNGIDWFLPTYYSGTDDLVQQGKVPSGALKDISQFETDSSLSHANLPAENKQEISEGSYIYMDFWVVSPGGDYILHVSTGEGTETGGSFVIDLPEAEENSASYQLSQGRGSAAAAVRVGFLANDIRLTDATMDLYEDSKYFDDRFTALKGMYVEPNTGGFSDEFDRFIIYEPNGDYHPLNPELNGAYVQTKSLELKDQKIQEAEVSPKGGNLTVQRKNTWALTDDGTQTKLEQQYRTALAARLGEVLTDQDRTDLFYGKFLQGQVSPYVSKGSFVRSTEKLLAYAKSNGGIVSAQTLDQDQKNLGGATDDVYIIQLERNVPQRIRMFIWLEGQDIDCVDSISSSRFVVNIELAGGDE